MIVATGPVLRPSVPHAALPVSRRSSERLTDVQVNHITSVLDACDWRIRGTDGAAERLGLKPTTLETRMERLGIFRENRRATA